MSVNAPLPFLAFMRGHTTAYEWAVIDPRYLAGREAVLLPRFAMVGEYDDADVIGLEYGQPIDLTGDLVIGTRDQLGRLRSLFESYRSEEANDSDAVDYWNSLIGPLDAMVEAASFVAPKPSMFSEGWSTWYSSRERFGSSPLA
jgi:hypothetical protein